MAKCVKMENCRGSRSVMYPPVQGNEGQFSPVSEIILLSQVFLIETK